MLADVREPNEVALGSIPSSVNLPLSGFEKSLSLDEGQSPALSAWSFTIVSDRWSRVGGRFADARHSFARLFAGDFTRIHGFHKPDKAQPIIFYCRAGVRAGTAVDLAKRAGFRK